MCVARSPVYVALGLTKSYETPAGPIFALRGVDLELHKGELVVFLGPSGSGKSTLLNLLGGLDRPTAGRLLFRGSDLTGIDERALTLYRRTHVGFVFQFYNLLPSLTVEENVALVTETAVRPLSATDALRLVGLEGRGDRFPAQLSGGEQQRVAVARAIAKQPEVLLCDEPTGALDSGTGVLVLAAIERANRELGAITVLVTHNTVIAEMADRVVALADGRVAGIRSNASRRQPHELSW